MISQAVTFRGYHVKHPVAAKQALIEHGLAQPFLSYDDYSHESPIYLKP